jgi:hypothetical protein
VKYHWSKIAWKVGIETSGRLVAKPNALVCECLLIAG